MIVIYFDEDKNSYCFNCAKTIMDNITPRVFEEENPLLPFVSYREVKCTICERPLGTIKLV